MTLRQVERPNEPVINSQQRQLSSTVCGVKSNGLVRRDIITNNRIKTWDSVHKKQAHGLVWGVNNGNKTSEGGPE